MNRLDRGRRILGKCLACSGNHRQQEADRNRTPHSRDTYPRKHDRGLLYIMLKNATHEAASFGYANKSADSE